LAPRARAAAGSGTARSVSTWQRAWWTSCTSRSARSCSAAASTCSRVSICASSATLACVISARRAPAISCWPRLPPASLAASHSSFLEIREGSPPIQPQSNSSMPPLGVRGHDTDRAQLARLFSLCGNGRRHAPSPADQRRKLRQCAHLVGDRSDANPNLRRFEGRTRVRRISNFPVRQRTW